MWPTGLTGSGTGARINVVAVYSHKRIVTPSDVTIVVKDVLALSLMILAVHCSHVRLRGAWIEVFKTVVTVIAVGGDCEVSTRLRSKLVVSVLWRESKKTRIRISVTVAEAPAQRV